MRIPWKRVGIVVVAVAVVAVLAGAVYLMRIMQAPSATALAALETDDQVTVVQADAFIAFEPTGESPTTGLILYPGGGVDFRAYAPASREIAALGYEVVIVSVPLNLAFFDINAADEVIADYPQIQHWAVGGHSLGGVAAASYAANRPAIDGLVFWASYPAGDALMDKEIEVLSISGSRDGLSTPQKIDESRAQLPADTRSIEIEGGNHAQFGSYGPQSGDNEATISPEAQWSQIAGATVGLLESLSE